MRQKTAPRGLRGSPSAVNRMCSVHSWRHVPRISGARLADATASESDETEDDCLDRAHYSRRLPFCAHTDSPGNNRAQGGQRLPHGMNAPHPPSEVRRLRQKNKSGKVRRELCQCAVASVEEQTTSLCLKVQYFTALQRSLVIVTISSELDFRARLFQAG